MKRKKFTVIYNGFHGYETHRVLGVLEPELESLDYRCSREPRPGYRLTLTMGGSKKFGCSSADCHCGEGLVDFQDDEEGSPFSTWISEEDAKSGEIEIKGNYPQS